jgi:hypothetical protein
MKLQEAVLCIDCECLYSHANHCPQCGSQVSYPLGRALDRPAVVAGLRGLQQAHEAVRRRRTA